MAKKELKIMDDKKKNINDVIDETLKKYNPTRKRSEKK